MLFEREKDIMIKYQTGLFLLGLLASPIVYAGNTTGVFQTSASINKTCSLSATSIDFGTLNLASGETDANGAINVLCTKGTSYTIDIAWGHTEALQAQNGNMIGVNSGDIVTYGINSSYHSGYMWGKDKVVSGIGNGATQAFTTYGRAYTGMYNHPAYPTPDNYADTVSVTLNY